MRRGVYEHKARKGLIRVEVGVEEGRIAYARISGDFFLYPEDAVWRLEEALRGAGVEEAPGLVERLLEELGVQLVGAEPRDFSEALRRAVEEARREAA